MRHFLCILAFLIRWTIRLVLGTIAVGLGAVVCFIIYSDGWKKSATFLLLMVCVLAVFIFLGWLYYWAADYQCRRNSDKG